MTIKAMLESYESELVIIVAIIVGAIIAVKVISSFIAGARLRAVEAAAEAASIPAVGAGGHTAGNLPAAADSPGAQTTATINNYRVSGKEFSLSGIDEKTAAMVLAIVASDAGIPLEELQFKSIRAIS